MQTLGITDREQKPDSLLKRLFWPGSSVGDVDALGQQGMWLCVAIAVLSVFGLSIQGHWLIGIVTAFVFLAGGMGIREHDVVAAVLIALIYFLNIVAALMTHSWPGVMTIFAMILLSSNVRGTYIAAKWTRILPPDELPLRMQENWRDKLIDHVPARVWPKVRKAFPVLAGTYLLFTVIGIVTLYHKSH